MAYPHLMTPFVIPRLSICGAPPGLVFNQPSIPSRPRVRRRGSWPHGSWPYGSWHQMTSHPAPPVAFFPMGCCTHTPERSGRCCQFCGSAASPHRHATATTAGLTPLQLGLMGAMGRWPAALAGRMRPAKPCLGLGGTAPKSACIALRSTGPAIARDWGASIAGLPWLSLYASCVGAAARCSRSRCVRLR